MLENTQFDGVLREYIFWPWPLVPPPPMDKPDWLNAAGLGPISTAGFSPSSPTFHPTGRWTQSLNFSLSGFPLQEARWGCGMPGISPGSSGDSWCLPLGEDPGMNYLLLRHATPLALFPALAAPQDFTAGYCSCQWGREKGMFTQTSPNVLRLTHTRALLGIIEKWKRKKKKHFQEMEEIYMFLYMQKINTFTHFCPQIRVSLCCCLSIKII